MERDRAYYRYQRKQHIKRKMGILLRLGGEEHLTAWTRDEYGRLAKGKIHCSCWMCRSKSYDEPTHSDARARETADQQVREYLRYEEAKDDEHTHPAGEAEQEGTESVS